jgi:hypothetical protein
MALNIYNAASWFGDRPGVTRTIIAVGGGNDYHSVTSLVTDRHGTLWECRVRARGREYARGWAVCIVSGFTRRQVEAEAREIARRKGLGLPRPAAYTGKGAALTTGRRDTA